MSLRPPQVPPLLLDAGLAAILTVVGQVEMYTKADDGYRAGPLWLNIPLVLLVTGSLALRRRFPRGTLLLIAGAIGLPGLVTAHTIFFWAGVLPLAIAVYTVARWSEGRLARFAWFLGLVATNLLNGIHMRVLWNFSDAFFTPLVFTASWAAGRVLRRMARQSAELATALEQLAEQQAAREEAAVQAERNRIALEMHDVVAHAVSLMVLQVGAARLGLEKAGPAPAQLRAAEETGRQALAELRRSLGVLRDHPDHGVPEPIPGLAAVEPLVEGFRAAGLDVSLDVEPVDGLPTSLQLSVYRVLQEALTNVLKHAGRVAVRASVRRDGDDMVVEVSNPLGRALTERVPSGGHGLAGMRERVGLFGGSLHAGPSPDGFDVRAHLPIPTTSGATS